MSSTVKERLIDFLKWNNERLKSSGEKTMGRNKFEKHVGIAEGLISNIGNSISAPTLLKIQSKFPELNGHWLLTGQGSMLVAAAVSNPTPAKDQVKQEAVSIVEKLLTIEDLARRVEALEKHLGINSSDTSTDRKETSASQDRSTRVEEKHGGDEYSGSKRGKTNRQKPGNVLSEGKQHKD